MKGSIDTVLAQLGKTPSEGDFVERSGDVDGEYATPSDSGPGIGVGKLFVDQRCEDSSVTSAKSKLIVGKKSFLLQLTVMRVLMTFPSLWR